MGKKYISIDKGNTKGHNTGDFVEETRKDSEERSTKFKKIGSLFDKRIWRIKDVAEFLGCSIGHIYNLASDEKIPKIKKGKFVYFVPERILDWVLEGD